MSSSSVDAPVELESTLYPSSLVLVFRSSPSSTSSGGNSTVLDLACCGEDAAEGVYPCHTDETTFRILDENEAREAGGGGAASVVVASLLVVGRSVLCRLTLPLALSVTTAVGADSVLLVPGKVTHPQTENHEQVWDRSIAAIRQLTGLADDLQVDILIENVGNGFCESPQRFAEYIDEIDHPRVGIHFDIGNHIRISPPADWIRVLGQRIRQLRDPEIRSRL